MAAQNHKIRGSLNCGVIQSNYDRLDWFRPSPNRGEGREGVWNGEGTEGGMRGRVE